MREHALCKRVCQVRWWGVLLLAGSAATSPCVSHEVRAAGLVTASARFAVYVLLVVGQWYVDAMDAGTRADLAPRNIAVHGWVFVVSAYTGVAVIAAMGVLMGLLPALLPTAHALPPPDASIAEHVLGDELVKQMQLMESHAIASRRRGGLFEA